MMLTVITATKNRAPQLAVCIEQVRQQSFAGFDVQHLVVGDGPDPKAQRLCEHYLGMPLPAIEGPRYLELTRPLQLGRGCKDMGIAHADGDYVCFWDDDNAYYPHALATLFAATYGVDVGIVCCIHHGVHEAFCRLPRQPIERKAKFGDIDTMCFCVRTEVARRVLWVDDLGTGSDHRWLNRLLDLGVTSRFVPAIIGRHT
jgi:glycosyltransferase involved in cell wall biosynthesis